MSAVQDVMKDYEEYKKNGRIWGTIAPERIHKIKFPRTPRNIVAEFKEIECLTATVSDVLDAMGINGAVSGFVIKPVIAGSVAIGNAVTLRGIPEKKVPARSYMDGDRHRLSVRDVYYIGEPGDVLIMDIGGMQNSTLGDQACMLAKLSGFAGTVINGYNRDVDGMKKIGYPVWSRGPSPKAGMFRIETVELNGPVVLHDIAINAGDLIIADDTGVVAIPFDLVEKVLGEVKKIIDKEKEVEAALLSGASLLELRAMKPKD